MKWLEFIEKMAGHLTWPVVVLAIVLVFRKPLIRRIGSMRELNAGVISASFDAVEHAVDEAEQESILAGHTALNIEDHSQTGTISTSPGAQESVDPSKASHTAPEDDVAPSCTDTGARTAHRLSHQEYAISQFHIRMATSLVMSPEDIVARCTNLLILELHRAAKQLEPDLPAGTGREQLILSLQSHGALSDSEAGAIIEVFEFRTAVRNKSQDLDHALAQRFLNTVVQLYSIILSNPLWPTASDLTAGPHETPQPQLGQLCRMC